MQSIMIHGCSLRVVKKLKLNDKKKSSQLKFFQTSSKVGTIIYTFFLNEGPFLSFFVANNVE